MGEPNLVMPEACQAEACAIQDCLQRRDYNDARCMKQIMSLYECCSKFYEVNGTEAKSVCCPKYPKLVEKLESLKR